MSDLNKPGSQPEPPRFAMFHVGLVFTIFFSLALGLSLVPQSLFAQPAPTPRITSQEQSQFQNLQQVYRFVLNNFVDQVDANKLMEGMYKGLFEALEDPYSVYLGGSDQREINDTTQGEFGGIGAYIEKQRNNDGTPKVDGFIEIAAPIEDTPAFRADLRSGDLILSIDEKSTTEMTIDQAVDNLRGTPDTTVELLILRGKNEPFVVTIKRQVIQVPVLKSAMIGDIAYIRLIQFTSHTSERFEATLKTMLTNSPKGLIIDLRNNPGGVLDAPLEIADMFLDSGPILSTKGRMAGENQVFNAERGKLVSQDLPVVIIVNGGSASASEILSGALKDRGRALLVGETTFGKGLVQRVIPLTATTGFKLTTSRYYTPSGVTIDKVGIEPNFVVPEPELSEDEEKDLIALRDQGLIATFLDGKPNPSPRDITQFQTELRAKELGINDRYLNRLIKLEMEKRNNIQSVFDLSFDIQLQKALDLIATWAQVKPELNTGVQ